MPFRVLLVVVSASLVPSLVVLADERPSLPPAVLAPIAAPSSDGRTATIAGAVLLGVSATFVLGSIPLWTRGTGPIGGALAGTLDAIGIATFVPGAILLPIGLVQASRHRRWYRQGNPQAFQWAPTASPSATGLNVGLQARF